MATRVACASRINCCSGGVTIQMRSSIVTLFTERPPARTGPSAFAISLVLHVLVCALILAGLSRVPRSRNIAAENRYTVRLLKLERPIPMPRSQASALEAPAGSQASAAGAASGRAAAPELTRAQPAPQTQVQPDLTPNLMLPRDTPIPAVLMWSAQNAHARVIVAPAVPQLPSARVHPSLEVANREQTLAEVEMASSERSMQLPTLKPSTTTPVVATTTRSETAVAATVSKALGVPTPARVISLSDLEMPQGTVVLPPANEAAAGVGLGIALSHGLGTGQTGTGTAQGQSDTGGGKGLRGTAGQGTGSDGNAAGTGGPAMATGAGGPGGSATPPGAGSDAEPDVTHLRLRRDGKFGVVVVGSSIDAAYPEAAGVWGSRLAYTVYLHVGLPKTWILQYALPRDSVAAVSGTVTRPEAPWPYDIVRPHLALGDVNADAVMVHGIVNAEGHFEKLGVVFPLEFAQTKFLLQALERWQFRPATQNGQIAAVEVLLIIPEESD